MNTVRNVIARMLRRHPRAWRSTFVPQRDLALLRGLR